MLCEKDMLFASTSSSYNPEVKVPLIIWGKKIQKKAITALTSVIDIFPTVLDLCGIPIMDKIHGKNIFSKELGHLEVLIDYPCYPSWALDHLQGMHRINVALFSKVNRTMITSEGYKIIWTSSSSPECYHLEKDSLEMYNLFPNTGRSLLKKMQKKYSLIVGQDYDFSHYEFNDIGRNGTNINLKNPSINKEIVLIDEK